MQTKYTDTGAVFSSCGLYRYNLWRSWGPGRSCVWVMLNPSKAGADKDDATIRRCVGFAKLWGYGSILVVNLYPLVSTDAGAMLRHPHRRGAPGDPPPPLPVLPGMIPGPPQGIVCAWGNNAEPEVAWAFVKGAEATLGWQNVTCLGVTQSGQPKHPVRLPYAVERMPLAVAQGRRTR